MRNANERLAAAGLDLHSTGIIFGDLPMTLATAGMRSCSWYHRVRGRADLPDWYRLGKTEYT
jgi:hypothetical protein